MPQASVCTRSISPGGAVRSRHLERAIAQPAQMCPGTPQKHALSARLTRNRRGSLVRSTDSHRRGGGLGCLGGWLLPPSVRVGAQVQSRAYRRRPGRSGCAR